MNGFDCYNATARGWAKEKCCYSVPMVNFARRGEGMSQIAAAPEKAPKPVRSRALPLTTCVVKKLSSKWVSARQVVHLELLQDSAGQRSL